MLSITELFIENSMCWKTYKKTKETVLESKDKDKYIVFSNLPKNYLILVVTGDVFNPTQEFSIFISIFINGSTHIRNIVKFFIKACLLRDGSSICLTDLSLVNTGRKGMITVKYIEEPFILLCLKETEKEGISQDMFLK